jgi:hypothetical protein
MNYRIAAILIASAALLFQADAAAQVQTPSAEEVVAQAAERSKAYTEAFKNLISEEKKTFEIYDKKGDVKKRRTVDSVFVVYPLSKKEGAVAEFRNVTAVDGKPVANSEARATDFFEKVSASADSRSELIRIQQESSRYDEDFAIDGLTLFPAIALTDELRPFFRFTVQTTSPIGGKPSYTIAYEQIRPHPSITVNSRSAGATNNYDIELDEDEIELNPRVRGRIVVDADSFNLRYEQRERTIQPGGSPSPIVVAEDKFQYHDSDHGILTPKLIEHLQYRVFVKDRRVQKDTRILLEYGKFTRPDVEVKSSEVKGEKP